MIALNTLPEKNLTKDQEAVLSRRVRKGPGKQSAVDALVINNLKEASIYAKHYCPKDCFSDGEIMSLCYDVLTKSAPRFRPSFGLRFVAFCKHRLRGAVKRHCCTLDVVKHASMKRTDKEGGPAFVMFQGGCEVPNRDKATIRDDSTAAEFYETNTQGGTVEFDFAGVDMRELWAPLKQLMTDRLNPRQRMVLRLVYDLGFNMQEIGDMLAVSRSAVQMTHSSALAILRREMGPARTILHVERGGNGELLSERETPRGFEDALDLK
jgi:RNA polymerase sigma factor (sigma-70 family)